VSEGAGKPAILWLGDPCCGERRLTGGKAAHLSRLAAAQRVPPGFCVTAEALEALEARGGEDGRTMPEPMRGAIAAAYQELGERCGVAAPRVAVRSSAVDEDGSCASFAGQYESYLNVTGAGAVEAAVERCAAAARAPRVAAYRERMGAGAGGAMAVLVQHLVEADVSAVAFSAHPVTGDPAQVVVTATWGLGESLVGGGATPDTYVISKEDGALLACEAGAKQRMTVLAIDGQGGTREVDVPRLLRHRRALDDEQARQIARLAATLEAQLGAPVDVECALAAGQLFLLQCRPVTSLPSRALAGAG